MERNNCLRTEILYEDKHILVVKKPAGLATQSARMSEPDVVSELKNYLAGKNPGKPPYLGIIHRLDQPVEGILVFAKSKQAAVGLSQQMQAKTARQMEPGDTAQSAQALFLKQYLAIAEGIPAEQTKTLTNYLVKEGNYARMTEDKEVGQKAVLSYKVLETHEEGYSLLEVSLKTGRFHQIRVQLAGEGHSILGDRKYGSEQALSLGKHMGLHSVALCAYKCSFSHPITGKMMNFEIKPSFLK